MTLVPNSESHSCSSYSSYCLKSIHNSESEIIECVKCESCGFSEECTPSYISLLRNKYNGRWLCGLCVEAVKDQMKNSESTEEALNRHIMFFSEFRSSTSLNQKEHPISAMGRVLRRSLDSPRRILRSNSVASMPTLNAARVQPPLTRSESCSCVTPSSI